ncbi:MAG: type II toxin-antitoxin system HicB family antitoxin [Treponema sp.]|nr:type II toxin-antitoxin system HicB family antitoxin [Treponema sp.]
MGNATEKYTYRVEWSEEDSAHVSRCLEFPSLAAHGNTVGDALANIMLAVEESVKWLAEEGAPVPVPFGMKSYKGNISLRIPAETHRKLAMQSAEAGVSVNQFILSKLSAQA